MLNVSLYPEESALYIEHRISKQLIFRSLHFRSDKHVYLVSFETTVVGLKIQKKIVIPQKVEIQTILYSFNAENLSRKSYLIYIESYKKECTTK
jgi:hypothetical protein